jgi:hypothetical protein
MSPSIDTMAQDKGGNGRCNTRKITVLTGSHSLSPFVEGGCNLSCDATATVAVAGVNAADHHVPCGGAQAAGQRRACSRATRRG